MIRFKPFKMASFGQAWPSQNAVNMHSSNPQPFTWQELEQLTGLDLKRLISQSPLAYESMQGHEQVRQQLVTQLYPNSDPNHISLISGAQEGIFIVYNSLLSKGDEMIAFTPGFEPLVAVAEATGAKVKSIHLKHDVQWSIPWELLQSKLTKRTKVLSINFPHNPTGATISLSELKRLIAWCEQHGIWLFSDEVFRGLEHDEKQHLPAVAELYERGISMGVMSKSMAMPGIRLGWLTTHNEKMMNDWLNIKSHLSICQSSLDAQFTAALMPFANDILKRNIGIITNNQSTLITILENNPNFKFIPAQAAATVFIETHKHDCESFCFNLLKNKQLYVMPHTAFLTGIQGFRMTLGLRNSAPHYQAIFNNSY